MYLKALEIQGFKSFPDKTVLTFGSEITAIVGPNGSGKSNIADAIRWVMGEQSSRTLRGSKMEDVIFLGTEKRKSLGFAEVTLVLDNSSKIVAMEETEVAVTRRYYRSGESEYYINRQACRLRDINELFMDTGLGREGYSIIGQGRIDEILSLKSGDRRDIFEEAAGISRYRHHKEDAERKLERTDENLVRINDRISELELQVEPLRVAAEKTKKYNLYQGELRGLEITLWIEQLDKIRTGNIKLKQDLDGAQRQKDAAKAEVDRLYADSEQYTQQIQEKDLESEQLRSRVSDLESQLHACENSIALLENDIRNNTENAARIQAELAQQEDRADAIRQQIAQRETRLQEIADAIAACNQKIADLDQQAAGTLASAGQISEELEALRQKERLHTASAGEARELISALSAAAQELLDRDDALGRERKEQEDRIAEAKAALGQLEQDLKEKTEKRDATRNVVNGYRMRCQTRQRKRDEIQERYNAMELDSTRLKERIRVLSDMEKEYEGYSKAVKDVMNEASRGALRGIRGPVANLIHVPDQYTVAIETALGGAMQNLVVERDEDGRMAIEWLKRVNSGRATFLPMNTIRPADFRERGLENENGFVGMADTLVSFDPEYRNIFSNLLGKVVIARDLNRAMAIARKYNHRFRIVTLDGQVMNVGGSMTGGAVSRSTGILSRANELERLHKQQDGLAGDMKKLSEDLFKARREVNAAEFEMEDAANELRTEEDAVLQLSERVNSAYRQIEDLEKRSQLIQGEQQQIRTRMEENGTATEDAKQRIAELEGNAAALRAESEAKAASRSTLQEKAAALQEEKSGQAAVLAGLEGEQSASEKSLAELVELRDGLAGDAEGRLAMISRFEEQNTELANRIQEQETMRNTLRTQSKESAAALKANTDARMELEGRRNQADRQARDKNSELLNMEREVSTLEQKVNAASMEENQLLEKLWDSYELSYDVARQQTVEIESVSKAQRRIGELRRAISGLGSINPDAVEEFQRVNERYTLFTTQRDDVTRSKNELEEIIRQITQEMTTIFREQFDRIAEQFRVTFLELFGGGRASLELEDPNDVLNCGIAIKAQPPGKVVNSLSQLSGGERAFIAVALYFAILKVRPTPFCVMDEIDAALDESNVARFARYIRQVGDRTQFIVITHRRGTMEEADVLYGVTMQEEGVSRMLTINLNDMENELHLNAADEAEY